MNHWHFTVKHGNVNRFGASASCPPSKKSVVSCSGMVQYDSFLSTRLLSRLLVLCTVSRAASPPSRPLPPLDIVLLVDVVVSCVVSRQLIFNINASSAQNLYQPESSEARNQEGLLNMSAAQTRGSLPPRALPSFVSQCIAACCKSARRACNFIGRLSECTGRIASFS